MKNSDKLPRHTFTFGPFEFFDEDENLVLKETHESIPLTARQRSVLECFLQAGARGVDHSYIAKAVWGKGKWTKEHVRKTVESLRKELRKGGKLNINPIPNHKSRWRLAWEATENMPRILIKTFQIISNSESNSLDLSRKIHRELFFKLKRIANLIVRSNEFTELPIAERSKQKSLNGTIEIKSNNIHLNIVLDDKTEGIIWTSSECIIMPEEIDAGINQIFHELIRFLNLPFNSTAHPTFETDNSEALRLFHDGWILWKRHTPSDIAKAIEKFNSSATLDPKFALPRAFLAESFFNQAAFGNEVKPPRLTMPMAEQFALEALDMDPYCAEAYTTLGSVQAVFHWDFEAAVKNFKKAISLSDYGVAHHYYANTLAAAGKFNEAIGEIEYANRVLKRRDFKALASYGWIFYFAGHYEMAASELKQAIELEPSFPLSHVFYAHVLVQMGKIDEALDEFSQALQFMPEVPAILASIANAHALNENTVESRTILQQLLDMRSRGRYFSPYLLATVQVGLEDYEDTYDNLELAVEEKSSWLIYLQVDPVFTQIRSTARFSRIVDKIGFGETLLGSQRKIKTYSEIKHFIDKY